MIQKNLEICDKCLEIIEEIEPRSSLFFRELCFLYTLDMPLEIVTEAFDDTFEQMEKEGFILSTEISEEELMIIPRGYSYNEVDEIHKFCPLKQKHFP